MKPVIIFDLDGTLVNTLGGITHSCNYVLEKNNYPLHSIVDYAMFVGHGIEKTLYLALPQEIQKKYEIESDTISTYLSDLSAHYKVNALYDTFLYEGVIELLDFLDAHHIVWGIHTNKTESIARSIIKELLPNRKNLGVIGLSNNFPPKPSALGSLSLINGYAPDEILFVGDSEVDIDTAQNLNVKSISVSWGYRDTTILKKLNTSVIYTPLELIKYLK